MEAVFAGLLAGFGSMFAYGEGLLLFLYQAIIAPIFVNFGWLLWGASNGYTPV